MTRLQTCRAIRIAALLAAGCTAQQAAAQSSATVYGVVDTFVTRIDADGVPVANRMDSSGLYASRLGFRGVEELGGGLKTTYTLEIGLNSNDGSQADSNRLFSRQAWVGLSGRWGEIRLGRQNTPQFYMNGKFDAFSGTTQASGWNNMAGAALRVDNAIGLFSPEMGGWRAQVLYARGAMNGAAPLPEVAGNRNVHLALEYERDSVYFGLNHEDAANSVLGYTVRRTAAGGSWAVDKHWKLFADANRERSSNHTIDSNLLSLSVLYRFDSPSSLGLGYTHLFDHLTGTGHGDASQYSIQYKYYLSKRTTAYLGYARLSQEDLRGNLVLKGAAVVEPAAQITSVPGGAIRGVQLGIAHSF